MRLRSHSQFIIRFYIGSVSKRSCEVPSINKYISSRAISTDVDAEVAVIGAGVVGLAIARHLSLLGKHDVLLIEKESRIGTGTSSRNSEVIHAGIYYPTGSLKAKTCVSGKESLYRYCKEHDIPHNRLGKLVVATHQDQIPTLKRIQNVAHQNGVTDIQLLKKEEALHLEPNLSCRAALWSPSTGIVDSHAFMARLHDEFEMHGGMTAFNSKVLRGHQCKVHTEGTSIKKLVVEDVKTNQETHLTVKYIINAAGLHAQNVSKYLFSHYFDDREDIHRILSSIPPLRMAKGSYFSLPSSSREPPFSRLIYPLPHSGGLGIHYTLDLAGNAKFGPNVEWLTEEMDPDTVDYSVDPGLAGVFEESVRTFFPTLPLGSLKGDYAGVRPKVVGPGIAAADFIISKPVDGILCLYGIESPGLTASLALAAKVEKLLW